MQEVTGVASKIVKAYQEKTPRSRELARQAGTLFPNGLTHDSRRLQPYGIYVRKAQGSQKWDVDGNRYIDYFGGHGALLLGHNHPQVLSAIHEAVDQGTHFGANHEGEVRWAEWIRKLIPSAERVRFTASGTEATMLALRLARTVTGKSKIVRFMGHFHGWNDHMCLGCGSHFDGSPAAGVLPGIADSILVLSSWDLQAIEDTFSRDPEIAGVILEPTGSFFGRVPVPPDLLQLLREQTRRCGSVLIFDEVVTGFRVSPGGAQALYNIKPDLTTLAKILGGGLPGGAVAGSKQILDVLNFEAKGVQQGEKVEHTGTFNANPVSAAAGVAALEIVAGTDACQRAAASAQVLRRRMNEVLESEGVAWAVYGEFSGFHLFTNPKQRSITPSNFDPFSCDFEELASNAPGMANKVRLAMLVHGVDFTGGPGGTVSAVHTEEDIERTAEAFRQALRMLRQ